MVNIFFMSKSDQWVSIIIVVTILIYLSVLTIGLVYHKISWLSILNIVTALSIVIYWTQKQFRISQHIFDPLEMAVLCFEVAVIGISVYTILGKQSFNWITIIQKVIFGIHLSVLIIFLVFMLTFKINKLI